MVIRWKFRRCEIFSALGRINRVGAAMMWFSADHGFRMSSFKSKIRGKKYALKHAASVEDLARQQAQAKEPKQNGFTVDSAGDFEFVNFNPNMFCGNRRNSMIASQQSSPQRECDEDATEKSSITSESDGLEKEETTKSSPVSEVVVRRAKENSSYRSRPPSWLCALPRYFISEESLNMVEQESK